MMSVNISDMHANLDDWISKVTDSGERLLLRKNKRDMAAVVGAAVAAGLVLRSGAAEADCPNIVKAIDSLTKAQGAQMDAQYAAVLKLESEVDHLMDCFIVVDQKLDKLTELACRPPDLPISEDPEGKAHG